MTSGSLAPAGSPSPQLESSCLRRRSGIQTKTVIIGIYRLSWLEMPSAALSSNPTESAFTSFNRLMEISHLESFWTKHCRCKVESILCTLEDLTLGWGERHTDNYPTAIILRGKSGNTHARSIIWWNQRMTILQQAERLTLSGRKENLQVHHVTWNHTVRCMPLHRLYKQNDIRTNTLMTSYGWSQYSTSEAALLCWRCA